MKPFFSISILDPNSIKFVTSCRGKRNYISEDLYICLQKRGLDTASLFYFPYRDDGFLLHFVIKMAVKNYVKL